MDRETLAHQYIISSTLNVSYQYNALMFLLYIHPLIELFTS
ncbi:hypothetical protein CU014_1382 [Enterococcus xinjiangensis]|nr:hypothetical protein [Enterococcus lactis]